MKGKNVPERSQKRHEECPQRDKEEVYNETERVKRGGPKKQRNSMKAKVILGH